MLLKSLLYVINFKRLQIITAELGIDSHEMREIFLAKIYELSNPSSTMGAMEDDFLCKL